MIKYTYECLDRLSWIVCVIDRAEAHLNHDCQSFLIDVNTAKQTIFFYHFFKDVNLLKFNQNGDCPGLES